MRRIADRLLPEKTMMQLHNRIKNRLKVPAVIRAFFVSRPRSALAPIEAPYIFERKYIE